MAEQPQTVTPQAAREFLTGLGHQPDALKTMDDVSVAKVYATAHKTVSEYAPKVIPFGEKWREALAGEDKDDMATLGRFQDPKALWGRTKELTKKLSSGELKQVVPFPKDSAPEVQAQWRKDNGVPESPEKYDIKLDGNIVVGDDDKPVVQDFLKYAHGQNWNNDQVKQAMQWYFGQYQPMMQKAQSEADGKFRQEAQSILAADWKSDHARNIQAVSNFMQRAPEKLRGLIWGGRLADGTLIGDHPDVLKWFTAMELELNPHTTLVGAAGADALKNVEGRIKEIEGIMAKNRTAYNKDTAMQEELRSLYDARDRAKERGKVAA